LKEEEKQSVQPQVKKEEEKQPLPSLRKKVEEKLDPLDAEYPSGLPYEPKEFKHQAGDYHSTQLSFDQLVYENAKAKDKASFFICPICVNIVVDPRECSGCKSLFCLNCISTWIR